MVLSTAVDTISTMVGYSNLLYCWGMFWFVVGSKCFRFPSTVLNIPDGTDDISQINDDTLLLHYWQSSTVLNTLHSIAQPFPVCLRFLKINDDKCKEWKEITRYNITFLKSAHSLHTLASCTSPSKSKICFINEEPLSIQDTEAKTLVDVSSLPTTWVQ